MNLKIYTLLVFSISILISFSSLSQSIEGKIIDQNKKPMPYVNVHKVNSNIGGATNLKGYYAFNLPAGKHIIEYRMVGYKTIKDTIYIKEGEILKKNHTLKEENVELQSVEIIYGEDPAVDIMKKVIQEREKHLNEYQTYSNRNFTKSIYKFTGHSLGNRILGFKPSLAQRHEMDSTIKADYEKNDGYFYTSEAETKLYKDKNKKKEVMVSSRVSGDPKQFSFNFSQNFALDFYENLIRLSFTDKLFVSPVASYAFSDYRYFLIDTFEDNGYKINKIKVIPKNLASNCFYGYVYIIDSLWRVHSLNLNITKENNLMFIDSINIKQSFTNIENNIWKPTSNIQRAYCNIEIMGISIFATLDFNSISQDFNFKPDFEKDLFSKELISINKDANQKDSLYWKTNSPLPSTDIERDFYKYKDSVYMVNSNPDTIIARDKIMNKFSFSNILTGYTYRNTLKKTSHNISAFKSFSFNTVQGWNINFGYGYRKEINDSNSILFTATPEYGFSDKTLRFGTSLNWQYNKEKLASLYLKAGINEANNLSGYHISPFFNTFYSELFGQNEIKLYSKTYFYISHYRELYTGLNLKLGSEIARRDALVNNSSHKWTDIGTYTSNNPLLPNDDRKAFTSNNSLLIEGELSWNPAMKYASVPNKIRIKSLFPTFYLTYKKAIPLSKENWADYDLVEIKMDYNLNLGKFGKGNLIAKSGKFLRTEEMTLADYKHYEGNRFHIGIFGNESFRVLPYYKFSTNGNYLEAHYTHNFNRWLFNKLPILKKTKLSEQFSAHLLSNDFKNPYMEISFGAANIFKILSLNYTCGFQNGSSPYHGITLSFGIAL